MSRISLLALCAAGVLGVALLFSRAVAQQPANANIAPQAGGQIALLDISYIFKNHARFKAMMTDMQHDVDAAEASVKKDRDSLKKLAESLEQYRSGSPEYQQLEQELAKKQADLQVQVQLQKKNFLQQEAKIYHSVYVEIMDVVNAYASRSGLAMVMRFNGDPVSIDNPQDVLRDINKPIVWYPKDHDITPYILEQLNRNDLNPRVSDRPGTSYNSGVPGPAPQQR